MAPMIAGIPVLLLLIVLLAALKSESSGGLAVCPNSTLGKRYGVDIIGH